MPSAVMMQFLRPFADCMCSRYRDIWTWSESHLQKFWLIGGPRDTNLSFQCPFSSTKTETLGSSDTLDANTQPAMPPDASQVTEFSQECILW